MTATGGQPDPDRRHSGGEPFIVAWSTTEEDLRAALAARLPGATVLRRMSGDRLVVRIPLGQAGRLAELPEVRAAMPDELRHPDGSGGDRRI